MCNLVIGEKIRLYPTIKQENMFWKFSNTARFVYNECLTYKIQIYQEQEYSCSVQDLIEHLQDLKYSDEYSWLREVPESVTKQTIKDLDKAYRKFFKNGNKGFPKFKKKGKCTPSFYQRTDAFRMTDSEHIKITGIKTPVRIRKHDAIYQCLNPRVTYDGKYWYFSYSYEIPDTNLNESGDIIGIDLGVKSLATLSNGVVYDNINKTKNVKQLEKRKRHLQRQVSRKYQMNKDGTKYVKTNNIKKLENQIRLIDRKLKNIRDTYIHTVTMDIVRTKPYAVVIEDLNVSNMLSNKYLSKYIQQQEFYKFRQYLTYKCLRYGSRLMIADRFYPSSKTCSCCGRVKKFLSLSERTFICPECGLVIDRDLNAAINLKNYYKKEKINLAS